MLFHCKRGHDSVVWVNQRKCFVCGKFAPMVNEHINSVSLQRVRFYV